MQLLINLAICEVDMTTIRLYWEYSLYIYISFYIQLFTFTDFGIDSIKNPSHLAHPFFILIFGKSSDFLIRSEIGSTETKINYQI